MSRLQHFDVATQIRRRKNHRQPPASPITRHLQVDLISKKICRLHNGSSSRQYNGTCGGKHVINHDYQLKEDEYLARALQEILKLEPPPHIEKHHPRCNVCKNFIYCVFHERDRTSRCCSCERMEGHYHMVETRGLCLSEEQTISTVLRHPRTGIGNWVPHMRIEPFKLTRRCKVTAIDILYGLPRLLTGTIFTYEMMHAWLQLNGYPALRQDVEEGFCKVVAHMWLTSQLAEFFKYQIESDQSQVYGYGFRVGNRVVPKHGLQKTLYHMQLTGSFPFLRRYLLNPLLQLPAIARLVLFIKKAYCESISWQVISKRHSFFTYQVGVRVLLYMPCWPSISGILAVKFYIRHVI